MNTKLGDFHGHKDRLGLVFSLEMVLDDNCRPQASWVLDFGMNPSCKTWAEHWWEQRGVSDVWLSQRYSLPKVPEPGSLGQLPCRNKE